MADVDIENPGSDDAELKAALNPLITSVTLSPVLTTTGSELVTDGDLATDPALSGWTLGVDAVWSAGQIVSTTDPDFDPSFAAPVALVSGSWYKITFEQTINDDVTAVYLDNNQTLYFVTAEDSATLIFQSVYTGVDNLWLDFDNYNSGATRTVTSLSVVEIEEPVAALTVKSFDDQTILKLGTDYNNNLAFGLRALSANTVGVGNVAIGTGAGAANLTGNNNVAIGVDALKSGTETQLCIAIGLKAMELNLAGDQNIGIGFRALGKAQTVGATIAIGSLALSNHTLGNDNIAIGTNAMSAHTDGANNVAIGQGAAENSTTAEDNVLIGQAVTGSLTSGADNVAIGRFAGSVLTTGSGNVCIGSGAHVTDADQQNAIAIGNGAIVAANDTVQLGNNNVVQAFVGASKVALENGISGSFTTTDLKTVTVVNGIITSIV
jgi:hypothetical protein